MKGCVCGPPRPPWNEMSSSKAQPSSRSVVEAAHHDVRDVLEAVRAHEVLCGVRREGGEWILALDLPGGEVASAVGPQDLRPCSAGADEQPTDVWVLL